MELTKAISAEHWTADANVTLHCNDMNEEDIDEFPVVFQSDECTVEGFCNKNLQTTAKEPKYAIV